ncbi:MAG: anion permease [Bacteroidales bacterium]|nr:anion permease [Bacteroidales bacterium]MDY6032307.1 SLC13 family permease [Alloprevotella sp.]
MLITLLILAASAVGFATGRLRSDVVALCALLLLLLTGILTPEEALAGFSNPIVIMMIGLFVVGGAIFRTGLAARIGGSLMRLAGNSQRRLFFLVVVGTALIGAFVSNTGTVALMLPIVVSMSARAGTDARRLLMPLAFASSMGGMLTLIGTPPNLVIQEHLTEGGYAPLSFFSFTPVGLICIAVGALALYPLSRRLVRHDAHDDARHKGGKSLSQLVSEYRLGEQMGHVTVTPSSSLCHQSLGSLDLRARYGVSVIEVRRQSRQGLLIRSVSQEAAGPATVVQGGDTLYLSGSDTDIRRFAADYGLTLGDDADGGLSFYDTGIAEILLMPTSRLVGRRVRESGLRAKYGINVLAVRRKGSYLRDDLADLRLLNGDVLLVHGAWTQIGRLNDDEDDFVLLGRPLDMADRVTLDYKAPIAALIMLAMIVLMVCDFIPVAPVTAVMLAAVAMVLTGCFRNVEAAYKTINWESVVLIGAMLPMSVALTKTGASALISHSLVSALGQFGPIALLAGIYLATSVLTFFVSNTATAVLMAPIAVSSATALDCSPYPFLFAVTLGASMCFASPFSTPPNALVMQAGAYRFADYLRVGLPLQLIIGAVMIAVLPLLFPF